MPLQNFLANALILRARRAGMARNLPPGFENWYPLVQRTWLASGGTAYHGTTEDEVSAGWHPAQPAGHAVGNAQRASDAAWAQERANRKLNKIAYQRDTGRPAPPEYGSISPAYIPPEERAQIAANQAKETARATEMQRAGASQRVGQPINAGTVGDRSVRVVGPHMIEYGLPSGGTAAFTTMQNGKLVDAHQYLMNKSGFVPHPEYAQARATAEEKVAGLPPVDTSKVVAGAGGDYLSRGGVQTPVENLNATDRMKYDAYPPGFMGGAQRVADTVTRSPAALAVGRAIGNGIDRIAGWMGAQPSGNVASGADTPAGVSRAQAARIQTPTQAAPVPVTETSPAPDVNNTKLSTSPTPAPQAAQPVQPVPLPDDWQNRRFAYEGF